MADDLKRSVQNLESPACPKCGTAMKWYRSNLASKLPLIVDHFFQCESCGHVIQLRAEPSVSSTQPPPSTLSRPYRGRPAA
jgi:hypothetical protein